MVDSHPDLVPIRLLPTAKTPGDLPVPGAADGSVGIFTKRVAKRIRTV
jgi:hypothetical protein